MPVRDLGVDSIRQRVRDVRATADAMHARLADGGDVDALADAVVELLGQHGFQLALPGEGDPFAFYAEATRHDREAMRKGLRHANIGVLIALDNAPAALASTWLAVSIAAALQAEAEYATVTVVGVPAGEVGRAARRLAEAGTLDEADVLFALEPTVPGDVFPRTIKRTGHTLAGGSGRMTLPEANAAAQTALLEQIGTLAAQHEQVQVTATAEGEDAIVLSLRGATSTDLLRLQRDVETLARGAATDDMPAPSVAFDPVLDDLIVANLVHRRVKTYGDSAKFRWDRIVAGPAREPHTLGALSYVSPLTLVPFAGTSADDGGEPSLDGMQSVVEYSALAALDFMRDMTFRALADDQLVRALKERGLTREHRRWLGVHRVLANDAELDSIRKGPKMTSFTVLKSPDTEQAN
jgi:hypothetical protein